MDKACLIIGVICAVGALVEEMTEHYLGALLAGAFAFIFITESWERD